MFEHERKKATFDVKQLSLFIYDGQQGLDSFLKRQQIVDNDPILRFDPATIHRSREDLLNIYAKKVVRYTELLPPSDFKGTDKTLFFPEQMPLGLH